MQKNWELKEWEVFRKTSIFGSELNESLVLLCAGRFSDAQHIEADCLRERAAFANRHDVAKLNITRVIKKKIIIGKLEFILASIYE